MPTLKGPLLKPLLALLLGAVLAWAPDVRASDSSGAPSCSESLAQLQKLLRELKSIEPTRQAWFQSSSAQSVQRALQVQIDWAEFKTNGLRAGEQLHWIQQSQLKELNEKLWDLGGTEFYLLTLDQSLADVLDRNPAFGRIIHRNYKDRVVVSSLGEAEFEEQVLKPAQQLLAERIAKVRERPSAQMLWEHYIHDSIILGHGDSFETAFLNLKLERLGVSFENWKKAATEIRSSLLARAKDHSLEWNDVLFKARKLKDEPDLFNAWLKHNGFTSDAVDMGDRVRSDIKLAGVADFLPTAQVASPREVAQLKSMIAGGSGTLSLSANATWDLSRALFLKKTLQSHYVLATDIQGLGAQALLAQDAWVARGASRAELAQVYAGTTEQLTRSYSELRRDIESIIGYRDSTTLYTSGDDGLLGLPALDQSTFEKIKTLLKNRPGFYTHIEEIDTPGNPESVARAIFEVRKNLFDLKPGKTPPAN